MLAQPFAVGDLIIPLEMPVWEKTGPFEPKKILSEKKILTVSMIWYGERDSKWLVRCSEIYAIFYAEDFILCVS